MIHIRVGIVLLVQLTYSHIYVDENGIAVKNQRQKLCSSHLPVVPSLLVYNHRTIGITIYEHNLIFSSVATKL